MENNISKHISYSEATTSRTAKKYGLDNTPNQQQLSAMKKVAEKIFEPLREHFNTPIYISSFFRSKDVNKKLGGSKTSQHLSGEAIDIDAHVFGKITNKDIFDYILNNLQFDQLISEYPDKNGEPSWIHVSYREGKNRYQVIINLDKN